MEDQTSLLQGNLQEDSFEVVMRGYNKRQVDDYVLQCQHHIRDLAQRLTLAEQEIERVRTDAATQIERVSSKPVHEEVSERLGQILRLANEEAERERANAAEEIAALRAQTLAETQALSEQAQAESEELRHRVAQEAEAVREQARAETVALRERVAGEAQTLRERTESEVAHELEQARLEAERVLTEARHNAERDVAQAHAQAQDVEETARSESEQLMLAAQQRAEILVGDAERRATTINTVLGTRLELLTTTHADVLARLTELRGVLVDALTAEEAAGPFAEVPSPAEAAAATARSTMPETTDPYVETAGEVAAAYEASTQQAAIAAAWGVDADVLDVDEIARRAAAEQVAAHAVAVPVADRVAGPVAGIEVEPVPEAETAGRPRLVDLGSGERPTRR